MQKKRKINMSKQLVSSDKEIDLDSNEETLSDKSDGVPISSLKKEGSLDIESEDKGYGYDNDNNASTEVNNDESVAIIAIRGNEDDISNNEPRVNEDVCTISNKLYASLGLSRTVSPGLGDCLIQSCILSLCNRHNPLT